ncbi:MAG: protease inhibitor I42 family protein [Thermoflexales bacterium]|nr:protease inhibitor I42 family protein [Thermoflexales bacterium]
MAASIQRPRVIPLLAAAFCLFAATLAACQTNTPAQTLTEQDAGKTVTVKVGDTLRVELDGNVTTGYNWIPAAQTPALLTQREPTSVTPQSALPGAPGKIVLQFVASATGQTRLKLDYKRIWETDVPPAKTYEVTVVVK